MLKLKERKKEEISEEVRLQGRQESELVSGTAGGEISSIEKGSYRY